MDILKSLTTGLVGSTALTGLHQSLRNAKGSPRVDLLGEQAVRKYFKNGSKLNKNQAYYGALAGDIFSNSIYYGLIAGAKRPVLTGLIMGVAAGYLAVLTPGLFGLSKRYVKSTKKKKYMTIGYYAFGGLVAGIAARMMK
jgi:hypothetical protein